MDIWNLRMGSENMKHQKQEVNVGRFIKLCENCPNKTRTRAIGIILPWKRKKSKCSSKRQGH